MTSPVATPSLYESFYLAGKRSPGVCRFTGLPTADEGWKKQEPKGSDGGETVRDGRKLIEFEVELYLFVDVTTGRDDFAAWPAFRELLLTPIKKNAMKALDIYHPILEGLGIASVVVSSWGPGEPMPDGKGGGTVKIKFLQYAPPKKKSGSGKPKGSKSSGQAGPGEKPDPNADIKAKVAAATEEYNAV